jgi:hypothetical protein
MPMSCHALCTGRPLESGCNQPAQPYRAYLRQRTAVVRSARLATLSRERSRSQQHRPPRRALRRRMLLVASSAGAQPGCQRVAVGTTGGAFWRIDSLQRRCKAPAASVQRRGSPPGLWRVQRPPPWGRRRSHSLQAALGRPWHRLQAMLCSSLRFLASGHSRTQRRQARSGCQETPLLQRPLPRHARRMICIALLLLRSHCRNSHNML